VNKNIRLSHVSFLIVRHSFLVTVVARVGVGWGRDSGTRSTPRRSRRSGTDDTVTSRDGSATGSASSEAVVEGAEADRSRVRVMTNRTVRISTDLIDVVGLERLVLAHSGTFLGLEASDSVLKVGLAGLKGVDHVDEDSLLLLVGRSHGLVEAELVLKGDDVLRDMERCWGLSACEERWSDWTRAVGAETADAADATNRSHRTRTNRSTDKTHAESSLLTRDAEGRQSASQVLAGFCGFIGVDLTWGFGIATLQRCQSEFFEFKRTAICEKR
jgi:hypothetical protein